MREVGLAALLVLVAACSPAPPQPALRSGAAIGRDPGLVVWVGPDADLPAPRTSPHLTAALHTPLVTADPVSRLPSWGDAAPGALLASLSSEDLRRWTLTLKPGWRWHDGTPVTAADLERGWEAAQAAGEPLLGTVVDVRAVSDLELAIALAAPFGPLPHLLTHPAFLPLHPDAVDADAADGGAARFLGTGPYRAAGRDGDRLALEAISGHPLADRVGVGRVVVDLGEVPGPEVDLAVAADGDLVPPPGPGGAGRTRVVRLPGRQVTYLGFPLTEPAYADAAVRHALSLAIDRERLAELQGGAVLPADRLVGPGMARAPGVACGSCRFDPAAAAERWPDGAPDRLVLWFSADAGAADPVIREIAERWRRVLGVQDIQLAAATPEALLERVTAVDVDGPFRLAWQADAAAPVRLLEPLFGPRGQANDTRFRSAAVTDLLAAAGSERDVVAGVRAYGAVEQAVLDAMPVAPLWTSTVAVAATPAVGGVVLDGHGRLDWTALRLTPWPVDPEAAD